MKIHINIYYKLFIQILLLLVTTTNCKAFQWLNLWDLASGNSGRPVITGPANVKIGETGIFTVKGDDFTNIRWNADPHTIISGQGTETCTIRFDELVETFMSVTTGSLSCSNVWGYTNYTCTQGTFRQGFFGVKVDGMIPNCDVEQKVAPSEEFIKNNNQQNVGNMGSTVIVAPNDSINIKTNSKAVENKKTASNQYCHIDDWTALKALYEGTDGDNWTNRTGWDTQIANQTSPPANCDLEDLYGIRLNENGRVTCIDFDGNSGCSRVSSTSGNNLTGNIPVDIINLIELTFLSFSSNQLNGNIPLELGSLSELIELHLSNNQLTGSIPPELGSLSNLTELQINNNPVSGGIPPELGKLSNLDWLLLYNNELSGRIPPELGNLSQLSFLNLGENQLTGGLPGELGNLDKLTQIYIQNNQLGGCYPQNLSLLCDNNLGGNWGGSNFDASWFDFCNSGAGTCVPIQIPNCHFDDWTALKALYESTNGDNWNTWIQDGWATHIAPYSSPPSNCNLQDLAGVNLDGQGRVHLISIGGGGLNGYIPAEMEKLSNLIELTISGNQQLIENIPAQLGNLANLTSLNLSGNSLVGQIPSELGNLTNLVSLILSNNQLNGNIPSVLGGLNNLGNLYLQNNQLNGNIPTELGNLTELWRLYLNDNQLSGNIPTQFGNLIKLRNMHLSNNQLNSEIPSTLGNLTELLELHIYNNQLSGNLPAELGNLTKLNQLQLNDNQFEGSIPAELGNISNLTFLHLHNNQLTGNIPAVLGDLSNLFEIDLKNNNLTGCFPNSFTSSFCDNGYYYKYVDFSGNKFDATWEDFCNSGDGSCSPELPVCHIDDWTALKALYNNTGGANWTNKENWSTIIANPNSPPTNCNLLDLNGVYIDTLGRVITIYLPANGLSGNIPQQIVNMEKLQSIHLADNQLTGSMPTNIGNLSNLKNLILDNNQLTGTLPSTIGNLKNLENLSLSNNKLSGSFPAEIANLDDLLVLNLYKNQFSGELPVELCNLPKLRILILRDNQLSGCYPSCFTSFCGINGIASISAGNNFNVSFEDFCNSDNGGCAEITNCHFDDWTALKALYESTNGDNWTNNTSWSSTVINNNRPAGCNLNSLYGVNLNAEGRVGSLSLEANGLSGTIPTEIGKLKDLTSIRMHVNGNLGGTLPPEIGNLDKLTALILNNTQVTGNLPPELGNLINLRTASLGNNNFTGEIPWQLGNLSELTELSLTGNQLTGEIPSELSNLTKLDRFNLGRNQLSGSIPASLGNLENLLFFNVYDNNLAGCYSGDLYNFCEISDNSNISNGNNFNATWQDFCDTYAGNCDTIPIPTCDSYDWYALKKLYESTNGDNWSNRIGWDMLIAANDTVPIDCDLSSLYGITLDVNGRVDSVYLASNQLTGNIPTEIEMLANLVYLVLGNNGIGGGIPASIGKLDLLKTLDLSFNPLGGNIPPEMGNLSSLSSLSLRYNQLIGNIPAEFGNLSNLTSLKLEYNSLTGCYPNNLKLFCLQLGTAIFGGSNQLDANWDDFCNNNDGNCNKTEMQNCYLEDWTAVKALYDSTDGDNWSRRNDWNTQIANQTSLPQNCNLKKLYGVELNNKGRIIALDLSSNNLTGAIPSQLEKLSSLERLELGNNRLNGPIPKQLANLEHLKELSLSLNQLSGEIPIELGNLNNLTTLGLSRNNLSGNIPRELSNLTRLTWLSLTGNNLSGAIPNELGVLSNLSFLGVNSNQLSGCYPSSFSYFCSKFSNSYISNSNNLIATWEEFCNDRSGICNYQEIIGCHSNDWYALKALYENTNGDNWTNTTGWSTLIANKTSPPANCSLDNLHGVFTGIGGRVASLNLSNNNLEGKIPGRLKSLSSLGALNLAANKLEGDIPKEIGSLNNLYELNLGLNQLSGEIPIEIADIKSLTKLILTYNQLEGNIPNDLGSLYNLTQLGLSVNNLQGEIPASFGILNNLDLLELQANQLSGCYHKSLLSLCDKFDNSAISSSNNFDVPFEEFCATQAGECLNSQVPNCHIDDWTALKALYESTDGDNWTNNTTWTLYFIPESPLSYCNLSNLHGVSLNNAGRVDSIILFYNKLRGNLPEEIGTLSELSHLNLAYNGLTGNIPNSIGALENLVYLNLSLTSFEGKIPASIGSLNNLETLLFGNSQLTGTIPSTLENLSNLTNLSLSGNNLSGSIPPELVNLSNLTSLGIANNQLALCYPESLKVWCDQFDNANISDGNFFNAPWENFCANDAGSCSSDEPFCPIGIYEENINWIASKSFDIDGTLKGASKSYFNDLGKLVQTQTIDIETNRTWAAQTLYDSHGRTAIQSLAAPNGIGASFEYQHGFMRNEDGETYSLLDFKDTQQDPSKVKDDNGTLGWYYSKNNTNSFYAGNDFQDVTEYPFSRTIYSKLNPGTILRAEGGNKVDSNQDENITDADEWPQAYSFSMPATDELSLSIAFGETKYKNTKTTKTVSRDVHGNENVVFTDSDGKVLAAARSGGPTTSSNMNLYIGQQGYVDIHIPQGVTGITTSNNNALETCNMITENKITTNFSLLQNGFYRIAVKDLESYTPNSIFIQYKVNYYDYSLNEYDNANRLVKTYQPLGTTKSAKPVTEYQYNGLSQLVYTKSPDEGEAWFKYREDGQIRYSQNSKQQDPNADGSFSDAEFSYTNYDTFGRPVESGVIVSTAFNTADPDGNLPAGNKKEQQFTTYDVADDATLNAALGNRAANYPAQSFVAGNVAYTNNSEAETWYSYDVYGRVNWMIQAIKGLGTKTIDYQYHPTTGLVTEVVFQKNVTAEEFRHRYAYDTKDRLATAETSTDGSNYTLQAEYFYYETGGLKRVELADGAQGVDYVYNLAGQLKAINHPGLNETDDPGKDANDLFGMQVDYHLNDYARTMTSIGQSEYGTDQLNGNIKGVRWNNANPKTNESEYVYSYDRNNWLTAADFDPSGDAIGSGGILAEDESGATYPNGKLDILEASECFELKEGFDAQVGSEVTVQINESAGSIEEGDYDVSNLTYDANGNIISLKRNKGSQDGSNAMDDLSYNYYNDKPNQLKQVTDAGGDAEEVEDITSQTNTQNYQYNSIGQLIKNEAEGIEYIYNTTGLVTEVQKDNVPVVKFYYNDRNHRTKKESYTNGNLSNTTYYIRDVSGSVMSIYNSNNGGSIVLKEQPVYGNGRIGLANRSGSNISQYNYQLTDHLGNVRAVFTKSGNTATMKGNTDYYPFGMPMPERNIEDNYRYAYQGQEKDPETGKEAFELRLWDSRIGRWLTKDPHGQYYSPYLGMSNSPINGIDTDGGFFSRFGAWLYKNIFGTGGEIFENEDGQFGIDRTGEEGVEGIELVYGFNWEKNNLFGNSGSYFINWNGFQPEEISFSSPEPEHQNGYFNSIFGEKFINSERVIFEGNKGDDFDNKLLSLAKLGAESSLGSGIAKTIGRGSGTGSMLGVLIGEASSDVTTINSVEGIVHTKIHYYGFIRNALIGKTQVEVGRQSRTQYDINSGLITTFQHLFYHNSVLLNGRVIFTTTEAAR